MRRDLRAAVVAVVALTVLLGVAYPLAVTGIAQLTFGDRADGSLVRGADGSVVGSRLIGQDFGGRQEYFQSRPSVTGYAADATAFSNEGPNSASLRRAIDARADAYLRRERPFTPGLRRGDIPPDAVMSSASGVDPHISPQDARIQASRVARTRGLSRARVLALVDQHTDRRGLGVLGEPGVNVLELNVTLDREARP